MPIQTIKKIPQLIENIIFFFFIIMPPFHIIADIIRSAALILYSSHAIILPF